MKKGETRQGSLFLTAMEKDLLITPDKTIRLTTHRLIHNEGEKREQLMLEDFINYELEKSSIGHYKLLTIIFSVITVFLFAQTIIGYQDEYIGNTNVADTLLHCLTSFPLNLSLICLFLSLVFFLISRRKYIKVIGKYDTIRFRVTSFDHPSIKKFLQLLVSESGKRKKESN
jgi:hypothetical protein